MTTISNNSENPYILYDKAISLLNEIRLVQGVTALNSTLRRHPRFRNFLIDKQVIKLDNLEESLGILK